MKTTLKLLILTTVVATLALDGCIMVARHASEKLNGTDNTKTVQSTDAFTD